MRRIAFSSVVVLGLLLSAILGAAATKVDPSLLAGLKARSIGPAGMSGRVAAVEGLATDPDVLYVGAATGGLWKSVDGGFTWEPLFDDQPVAAIGAVAVNQSRPDVVWVGTGEGNLRNSVSIGNGVYKSLDAGRTWTHLGLEESERIHRIRLHPDDPDVAYVAAMGKLWGDSEERGVYRTRDGGRTWQRILYVNERTGCADLTMDPANPDRMLAAMYEFRRWPWFFDSGGPGSGLYLTLDGGDTWKQLTPEDGLPEGELGRIGLAVSRSDPSVVYALIEAEENAFYRSDDGGLTWKQTSKDDKIGNRPFYYADIRVDPEDPNRVYSLWSQVSVSKDGGKTWGILIPWQKIHPDHHALWIDPLDGRFLIEGNDGGVAISRDRGKTWRFVANLPIAQYYHIAVDEDVPYHVYGGMQDNGSWRGPSAVWENGGIRNLHWEEVGFGDGFDTRPYPGDSMQGYAMSQEGYVHRWNLRTGERRSIRPAPPEGEKLRFNWNAALAQDPFDEDTIYYGSQYVHRSTDRGETWTRISDDLTTDNPDWQKQDDSGGLTPDVTGAENFTTIVAIAPSPVQRGVIWVGTDDGRVHVTQDGGQTWTSLEDRAKGVPKNTWVPHIGPSPHDAGTAFVVFDDHRRSNMKPYAYRTTDFGRRWENLVTDDLEGYCLVLEQDPVDPDLLFLGTEFGLYVSLDGGERWMRWKHGVPTVSVMDLLVHPREGDLVLGTHGRAAFILDDIRPLRTLSTKTMAEPLHLFPIAPAQQYWVRQTGASRFPGATEFRGTNRPYGAIVTFSLHDETLPLPDEDQERARKAAEREAAAEASAKQKASKAETKTEPEAASGKTEAASGKTEAEGQADATGKAEEEGDEKPKIKVEILDSTGKKIRSFEKPVTQGVNRIVWDLHTDPFKRPPTTEEEEEFEDSRAGPEVMPGTYTVVLRYGEHEVKKDVEVRADPRLDISQADRQAAWDAVHRAGKIQETIVAALQRIQDTRGDLDFVIAKVDQIQRDRDDESGDDETTASADSTVEDPWTALSKEAKALKKSLKKLDDRLRVPQDAKGYVGGIYALRELNDAQWLLGSSWRRPTPAMLAYLDKAEHVLAEDLEDFNRFFGKDVPAFREKVEASGLRLLPAGEPLRVGDVP